MEDKIPPIKSFMEEASQPLAITLEGLPISGKNTLIELLEIENFTLISRDPIIASNTLLLARIKRPLVLWTPKRWISSFSNNWKMLLTIRNQYLYLKINHR